MVPMMPGCTNESKTVVAKQKYSTNPESVPGCNRRRSNSCTPSASFLPTSVDAKTLPGQFAPRGGAAARSNHVCEPAATGVGYHDGNSHCGFLASRKKHRRQDGIMTSAGHPSSFRACVTFVLNDVLSSKTIEAVFDPAKLISQQWDPDNRSKFSGWSWRLRGEEVDFVWVTDDGSAVVCIWFTPKYQNIKTSKCLLTALKKIENKTG